MILTAEEKQELELLFRLVDDSVVLRNQMLRAEQDTRAADKRFADLRRQLDVATVLIERQREKMTLAAKAARELKSNLSRA